MFERYDESARRVLFFARFEASQVGMMSIETEHLLLGLLREGKGLTARLLSTPPLSPEAIRGGVERRIELRDPVSTSIEIPFSEDTRRVLLRAVEEADALGSHSIRPEHLLLGILREEKSLAATVLLALGANIRTLREAIASDKGGTQPADDGRAAELRESLVHLAMMVQDVAVGETLAERTRRARDVNGAIEAFAQRFLR
jgi:ATP-dependent Clp protease ATP-binding subunit ClpC